MTGREGDTDRTTGGFESGQTVADTEIPSSEKTR